MKPVAAVLAALLLVIGGLMALVFTTVGAIESAAACGTGIGVAADGFTGTAATGDVVLAQANIPQRSGMAGFRASMPRVLSHQPDAVTLNEQAGRTLAQIRSAAPGYDAYRNPSIDQPGQASQALDTVVLWRTDTWHRLAAGRIRIVSADHVDYGGRLRVWNRYATWVLLANSHNQQLAIVSVHQMTNPDRIGPDKPRRRLQYGQGMDAVLGLVTTLSAHGPVFIGGDFNVHPSQAGEPWTAPAKMATDGYRWYERDVDYLFYPAAQGARRTGGWSGPMDSDHPWIASSFRLPSNQPRQQRTVSPAVSTVASTSPAGAPGLDAEQSANAAKIIAAGRAPGVYPGYPDGLPVRGQAIAIMTALGESGLRVLDHGDTAGPDSRGLFQQRSSWGSLADRMDPTVSATLFYNALIQVPGWQTIQPTLAAHAVQRNADPHYYTQFWDQAASIVAALGGNQPISAMQLAIGATDCGGQIAYVAGNGTFGYPVPANLIGTDEHNYGRTGSHWATTHTGTDFAVPCGTPVLAVNSGTVQLASTWWGGPHMVGITGQGIATWYAHMATRTVTSGQQVAAGQQIGLAGAEGNATGCHLHLEVRQPGTPPGSQAGSTNPSAWLAAHVRSAVRT
ncbi:MAG: peptidoglycan DD-metalloendopeptidase family protein [Acidimicrobiaceae bacterium]|nr:peptidoglycan DD-metalloendopeptidase family protein [Acidimicrobiaceae bacterium]